MRIEYREIGQYIRPVLVVDINAREKVFSLQEIDPGTGNPCMWPEASSFALAMQVCEIAGDAGDVVDSPGTTAQCPTGAYYVSLVSGGIKAEGRDFPRWHGSKEGALKGYLDSVVEYAKNNSGVLWWREWPSFVCDGGKWQVYSRLVIA